MSRLKKGDTVVVLAGKDRGKKGKVLQVWPDRQTALIERINLTTYFDRRTRQDQPSGMIQREAPMPLAKVALVCPRCQQSTRIGMKLGEGTRQRQCKACGEVLGT